jgi:homospermidine synthase
MKIGSCAAEAYEPRQVRKEAAVSRYFRVPQGYLVGASWLRKSWCPCRGEVHGHLLRFRGAGPVSAPFVLSDKEGSWASRIYLLILNPLF